MGLPPWKPTSHRGISPWGNTWTSSEYIGTCYSTSDNSEYNSKFSSKIQVYRATILVKNVIQKEEARVLDILIKN